MLKPKQLLKLLTLALKIDDMLSLFPCPSPLLQLDLSVVTNRFNLLYERYLSKVSGVLVLVQHAIDLYMGLGQGKLRAMELNLCLDHLKRE